MKFCIFIFIFLVSCSTSLEKKYLTISEINEGVNISWNYQHSSAVIYGVIVNKNRYAEPGACKVDYSVVAVVESFKGDFAKNQLIKIVTTDIHNDSVGGLHLFFVEKFSIAGYPGMGKCENNEFDEFSVVHNWCCEMVKTDSLYALWSDEINSAQTSKPYLIDSKPIFEELRILKQTYKVDKNEEL